jgi:transcriptional/translational regulatory protein YebC/TACO1
MSGHSKWSTIKHKKARTDEKKGKAHDLKLGT